MDTPDIFEDLNFEDFGVSFHEGQGDGSTNTSTPGSLEDRYIAPPFSVLDTKQGYWQQKKKELLKEMGENGESRENTLDSDGGIVATINNGVSILDPVLAQFALKCFTPKLESIVLDPFAGDLVFGYISKREGHFFTGIELREEQAVANQERCDDLEADGSAKYINDSSENIDQYINDESVDFVFSCPPYYDLEVYSDLDNDLSNQETYEDFYKLIEDILTKTANKLKQNRFAMIAIGEIRNKDGSYCGFVPDIIKIMTNAGLSFYNEIIIYNSLGSAPMRANNYMASRKVVKVHQNALVFYKGDIKHIQNNFPKMYNPEEGETDE